MSYYCFLDRLPAELLHTLFDYFVAHEILFAFSGVSDYVDSTLCTYSAYRLDFRSIGKAHFDWVCRHIRAEQVISLILSDADDTPVLSQFFFSRFCIEQFTQLRSLVLIEIELDTVKLIFSNLHKLYQLCALSFDDRSIRYPYPTRDKPVFCYLNNVNVSVLSQLNRLHLNSGTILTSIPLPHLRYLKLETCTSHELSRIFQLAPQIKSLCVCVDLQQSKFEVIVPSNQLTQLNLEIKNNSFMIMREMNRFLLQFPHLKHLELKALARNDMPNGYDWETLASSLTTFNFKFRVLIIQYEYTYPSFWGEEKRYSVGFHDGFLFSIPHFARNEIDLSKPLYDITTAPDNTFLYNYVHKMKITTPLIKHRHYFTHIKILELGYSISFEILESVIDLKQVEHLIIPSLIDLLIYMPLKDKMPQLNKLTIQNSLTFNAIRRFRQYQLEQILQLEIRMNDRSNFYIIDELFRLFPSVQHLKNNDYIQSEQTMIRLIDGFQYLSHASFYRSTLYNNNESNFCQNPNTIIQHSQRLTPDNFTCRIYHSSDNNLLYNWWINEDVPTQPRRNCRLPERRSFSFFPSLRFYWSGIYSFFSYDNN